MTLLEALKIGKRFYRKSWNDKQAIAFEHIKLLSNEAFFADDWEVEESCITAVTITAKDYWCAAKKAQISIEHYEVLKVLAKELGLFK